MATLKPRCEKIFNIAINIVILAIHHRQQIIFAANITQHTLLGNTHSISNILH